MRFLLDMPLSPKTAAFLRELGHDATHLGEQGLQRLPDPEIVEKAKQERRVIITMDLGFGHLLAYALSKFPSVILFRVENERPEHINQLLKDHMAVIEPETNAGAIITITDNGLRIHRLPILPE